MPVVSFVSENLEVDVDPGISLIDICAEVDCDITFGCRSGSCGTCRVKVVKGQENISPPNAEEAEFLRGFHAASDERLACQLKISGNCSLQYVGLDDL